MVPHSFGLSIYRLAKKYGRNVGRVMLKTIYAILMKQEAFRPMEKGPSG